MLNLELCTLHFQETQELEQVLLVSGFCRWCGGEFVTAREQGFRWTASRR